MDIRPVVGGVPVSDDAAALSTAFIAADRIVKSPSGDFTGVDLPGGVAVQAGDVLALVAHTHAGSSSPFWWSGGDPLYAAGGGFLATPSGSFTPSSYDYAFQVYVAEVPEPSSFALLAAGAAGCLLTEPGRKAFFSLYGRRMAEEITHPVFGYRLGYRRMLILHARMIAAWLCEEIPTLAFLTTR